MSADSKHDLAGKVDALVGRYGATAKPGDSVDDRNIPVLTEIIAAPEWEPLPEAASTVLNNLSHAEVDQLSHAIFSRVYGRIDRELAGKLEERIAMALAHQIHLVIADVITDLRQDIANEIGDAVNAALADHLRDR
ncbi:MAG TPA: hypothetical protein VFV17_09645 [Usitatibacteraceae bacterium]|nr:hypothetical protein [Usitatibacteraceae bacterium]